MLSVYVHQWVLPGKMFRIKLDLPEWKADEDVGRHLLKLVCKNVSFKILFHACILYNFYRDLVCVHLSKDIDKFHFLV